MAPDNKTKTPLARAFPALAMLALGALHGAGAAQATAGPPIGDLRTVGMLELQAPNLGEFILRGTLPVPPGVFPRRDGRLPFGVLDYDGTLVEAQSEIVTRYAADVQGAEVVEIIARVRRDPAVSPGTRIRYPVVRAPHPAPLLAGPASITDLLTGPAGLSVEVQDLISNPYGLIFIATDCFGNAYASHPLSSTGPIKRIKYGTSLSQVRSHQTMLPVAPVTGARATLPHFLGVHTYVTTMEEEGVVLLDLRFHNAHSGLDLSTTDDDPLGILYFRELSILVPTGWYVQQDFPSPTLGGPIPIGGYTLVPLVTRNADGSMHVMQWQAHFNRRLAISRSDSIPAARNYLDQEGLAFSRRGSSAPQSPEWWSWWNDRTDRYFPQSKLVPSLEHLGLSSLRSAHTSELATLANYVATGTGTGNYPVQHGNLGWAHPYGVTYGGMTGGQEIHFLDGIRTVEAASTDGYRQYQLIHRMASDRQRNAMFNDDGDASSIEDWLITIGGGNDYVPFDQFTLPKITAPDPFGFGSAPQFQVQYVQASGLQPAYEGALFSWAPHDHAHLARYTRLQKVLIWLGNDTLAKDDLRMQAEVFNLAFHPYWNVVPGRMQDEAGRWNRDYIDTVAFASGFRFGRGEGWGLDCMAAAYATSDFQWRMDKKAWFDFIAGLLSDGQGACNGFLQAENSSQIIGGRYRGRQSMEHHVIDNGIISMLNSVYAHADPVTEPVVRSLLIRSEYAAISDMAWAPGQYGPWTQTGVGPLDDSQPVWCSTSQMPGDAIIYNTEKWQNWSSFGYGFELTGDPIFLQMAEIQSGSSDLLGWLLAGATYNLPNRAVTLARVQKLAGVF